CTDPVSPPKPIETSIKPRGTRTETREERAMATPIHEQPAVAVVSDDFSAAGGGVVPATYVSANPPARIPTKRASQQPAPAGSAFSSDAPTTGWSSVSDTPAAPPSANSQLRWRK